MFYVFNVNGVFQSAHMVMRDAHGEAFATVGSYYVTETDANNSERDQIKAYAKRCEENNEKETARRIMVNEHYRTLNVRFEERERVLLALGFKRVAITEYNLAVYTATKFTRRHTVAAATLSQADEIVWTETLETCKRFVS